MENFFLQKFEAIGFDADDTLWENETLFHNSINHLKKKLNNNPNNVEQELLEIEKKNIPYYGYGIKGFILSMIETYIKLSDKKIDIEDIEEFLDIGKKMLLEPIKILPGVESVLGLMSKSYVLILITKGDLLDQERKIDKSNLKLYFNHIEVVPEKDEETYKNILKKHNIDPKKFLMVGNSLKSDIIPVINVGGKGVFVPSKISWDYEEVDFNFKNKGCVRLKNISSLKCYL